MVFCCGVVDVICVYNDVIRVLESARALTTNSKLKVRKNTWYYVFLLTNLKINMSRAQIWIMLICIHGFENCQQNKCWVCVLDMYFMMGLKYKHEVLIFFLYLEVKNWKLEFGSGFSTFRGMFLKITETLHFRWEAKRSFTAAQRLTFVQISILCSEDT